MRIDLELFGVSRLVIGEKEISLDLEKGMTFREIVRRLGEKYPRLMDDVIRPDGETLHPPNIFNLNGKRLIQEDQMDESPENGDRIILMSISAGG